MTLWKKLFGSWAAFWHVQHAQKERLGEWVRYMGYAGSPYHTVYDCEEHGFLPRTFCGLDARNWGVGLACGVEEPFVLLGWPKCKRCAASEARRERKPDSERRR